MSEASTNYGDQVPEVTEQGVATDTWIDLCRRVGEAGLRVTLLWGRNENGQDIFMVTGYIARSGTSFELPVQSDDPTKLGEKALNLFYHPLGRLAHVQDKTAEELFVNKRALDQKAA